MFSKNNEFKENLKIYNQLKKESVESSNKETNNNINDKIDDDVNTKIGKNARIALKILLNGKNG